MKFNIFYSLTVHNPNMAIITLHTSPSNQYLSKTLWIIVNRYIVHACTCGLCKVTAGVLSTVIVYKREHSNTWQSKEIYLVTMRVIYDACTWNSINLMLRWLNYFSKWKYDNQGMNCYFILWVNTWIHLHFMNSLIHWFDYLYLIFVLTEVMKPTLVLIGVAVLLSLQSVWCVQEDPTHGGGHGKEHNPIHKEHYHDGAHDPHYDHEAILGMSTNSSITSV